VDELLPNENDPNDPKEPNPVPVVPSCALLDDDDVVLLSSRKYFTFTNRTQVFHNETNKTQVLHIHKVSIKYSHSQG
jgi:hypothetical protein